MCKKVFEKIIEGFSIKLLYKISLISMLVFFEACKHQEVQKLRPPNIILLVSEDNSPFLGSYGDTLASTPNLDIFSESGIRFTNAFANAPVCAPSRSTIISGMYATSMGTQHMRSENPSPDFMKFFPYYLKKEGYFTSNRVKKDYNTVDQDSVWDVADWWGWKEALIGKKDNQPFFLMYNSWMSHESKIHPDDDVFKYYSETMAAHEVDSIQMKAWWDAAKFDTNAVNLPSYHPNTPAMRSDWAKYYECMTLMDREMGVVLNKIKEDGYWDNSIIIYMSDHGGVLARSKRFVYDSGLRVPFVLHVPEKYKDYVNHKMGSVTDQMVSFVDLAPSILAMAGIEAPAYLEGNSFLIDTVKNDYAFGFRGRMDERYDMVRTVRDKKYRYIRNYMPHRISAGRIQYLWKANSINSWEKAYQEGNCNEKQAAFWKTKPVEELYDITIDPDNTVNLAENTLYKKELQQLREVLQNHFITTKDLGFVPEAEMIKRSAKTTPYDFVRSEKFPYNLVVETANIATEGKPEHLNILLERLSNPEPVVRYWAATGCAILKSQANQAKEQLIKLLNDESLNVRITAAEALFYLEEKERSIKTLTKIIELPKMKEDDLVSNKELYSNHFAITNALNVIDALNIDTEEIKVLVDQIANSKRSRKGDFDYRMAENLMLKFKN